MKTCGLCNNNINSESYLIGRKYQKIFCNRSCFAKYQQKLLNNRRVNINCGFCLKNITKTLANIARTKHGINFCNVSCSTSYHKRSKKKDIIKVVSIPKLKPKVLCKYCNKNFVKNYNINTYCSKKCFYSSKEKHKIESMCLQCNKNIYILQSLLDKGKGLFCSKSCSSTYRNLHTIKRKRIFGGRVSKIEEYIQNQLIDYYPDMDFIFNCTNTINFELDIYIPQLKLAFEINGPSHYRPIYGLETFIKSQKNDKKKFYECLKYNIELFIIDISSFRKFKETDGDKVFNDIINIINKKILIVSDIPRSKDELKNT